MSESITLHYPYDSSAHYDIDYITRKHMPEIHSRWGSHGLTLWHVTKYTPGPKGTPPPYAFSTTLLWWEKQDMMPRTLSESEFKKMMDDIKGFCDKEPIVLSGEVVGMSSQGS